MTYEPDDVIRASVEQFIQERKYLTNVSPKTLIFYRCSFRAFAGALGSVGDVMRRIAELREKGVSAISVNTYLTCINAYFRWAGKDIKLKPLKTEQTLIEVLSTEKVRNLLAYKAEGVNLRRAQTIAIAILDTGLRASEVLGITRGDVDFENLLLKVVGKGKRERLVPFSHELRRRLFRQCTQMRPGMRFVFGTRNDTRVSVRNLERDFACLGQRIGIKLAPHLLRHTFACHYLKNGGNLEYLRRVLGHSNLSTTQKYVRSLGIESIQVVHHLYSPISQAR